MTVVHLLRVELTLVSPGAVAAPESRRVGAVSKADLPVATEGWDGRTPYIPGTSLAGSLRAHTHPDRRKALFGDVQGEPGAKDTVATASSVRVLGTKVQLPPDSREMRRNRTAIDRHRGAARELTLHSRDLLPPGTRTHCWLRFDSSEHTTDRLDELVQLLSSWQPFVGRGRTTGQGEAQVDRVLHRPVDLTDTEGLLHWLTRGGPELVDEHASTVYERSSQPRPPELAQLFGRPLEFRLVDGVHIGNDGVDSRRGETDVARILRDHENRPVVPGTSWKGVLRARAEFVLRSVERTVFKDLKAIDGGTCSSVSATGPCGRCVLCTAFGWTERTGTQRDTTSLPSATGARGLLLFADTPIQSGRIRRRNHVALDRIFGGARDGALFTEEVVEDGTLTLSLRVDERANAKVSQLAHAALTLALLDLSDGRFGIGAGTTRGQGTLQATKATHELLTRERPGAVEELRRHLEALRERLKSLPPQRHATDEEVPA